MIAPRDATVLVVGVGGIGTPCAASLAAAGVGRLVLVDPDHVDGSNLPRQVLFEVDDLGRAKAVAAAARLARAGLEVRACVERFDLASADRLLAGVDVVVDGTDGATSKDTVHALAVAAGLPVVHAAALGAEGRVLDVAAGGRPCLACVFGFLGGAAGAAGGDVGDTCARHGVFPGVVGAVGHLAAAAALARLADPRGPTSGLRVLDLGAGRGVTLAVAVDPACPVCAPGATPRARLARPAATRAATAPACAPLGALDLREEACPMNLLRARRAVDRLAGGDVLEVWLGEEGAATVPEGLASLGHAVVVREPLGTGLRLVVARRRGRGAGVEGGASDASVGDDAWLRRYARQIVLPGVGEEGQRALHRARVVVTGRGPAAETCADVLVRAGIGAVERRDGGADDRVVATVAAAATRPASDVVLPHAGGGAVARARGALLADGAMRAVLGLEVARVVVRDDATVGT